MKHSVALQSGDCFHCILGISQGMSEHRHLNSVCTVFCLLVWRAFEDWSCMMEVRVLLLEKLTTLFIYFYFINLYCKDKGEDGRKGMIQ